MALTRGGGEAGGMRAPDSVLMRAEDMERRAREVRDLMQKLGSKPSLPLLPASLTLSSPNPQVASQPN
ncbi:hypothetical protein EON65_58505 [archaeon]|nr:MAG: hypothetical protein EON65_58505 [archaeon]